MGEQAVITPAMLAEEEQLEAAGLEKERQMLEKVRGSGAACPAPGLPPACLPCGCVWSSMREVKPPERI